MAERTETINAQGIEIGVVRRGDDDYISLTDIARYKSDEPSAVIANWMRLRDTIDYLGVWESLNNPEFNSLEFEGIEAELESMNAQLIRDGMSHKERAVYLNQVARWQMSSLESNPTLKKLESGGRALPNGTVEGGDSTN